MPANLPPEYFEAEKRFKEAQTYQEKIAALEGLIATVPKHKGTDKLRADLRRRLSRLREEAIKKRRAGKSRMYVIERHGAAQIALVGLANSGKSSILAALTNAKPVIADYPMSTVTPLSGMMPYEDIQFQIIDLPPIGNESTDGWVSSIIRMVNVIMLVVDLTDNADVQVDLLIEQLNRWRIPISRDDDKAKSLIIAANKVDLTETPEGMGLLQERFGNLYPVYGISAIHKTGIEGLKRGIFLASGVIRVYSKEPGKEPDMNTPFTLPAGSNVLDLAEVIHKDFVKNFRYACIWGSARFSGQRVNKDYILQDGDIVEYHV